MTLEASYERCRLLNKRYGTTYYWSTYALPRVKRHHVHALYGFCRYADDIVDALGPSGPLSGERGPSGPLSGEGGPSGPLGGERGPATLPEVREKALTDFGDRFFEDLDAGDSNDEVLKAVVHTVRAFRIDPGAFRRFLRSMAMDLTVGEYETWDDLLGYMDGSAAVIGEMMLPILEPTSPEALGHARDLGNAFQLTNFLRDVDEDLDRGRTYIPQEDVRRFGAADALAARRATPEFVALMAFEIERCRMLYRSADEGLAYLPPTSARCIRAARALYSRILDRIEGQSYDVFSSRARVPTWQKAATVGRFLLP